MLEILPSREVALAIGPIMIRWYGIFYVVSFLLAWWLLPRLQASRQLKLTRDDWLYITVLAMAGVMIGGRAGYIIFYEPGYFLVHPLHIFFLWQGGMASHGGIVGGAVAVWYAARKLSINVWSLFDIIVIPAALGLALGRVGNFLNQELYGVATTLPWGVLIPGVAGARHPVQLYEAVTNLTAGLVVVVLLYRRYLQPGIVAAWFIVIYALLRLLVSLVREPDVVVLDVGAHPVAMSQLLTMLLLLLGIGLITQRQRQSKPVRSS